MRLQVLIAFLYLFYSTTATLDFQHLTDKASTKLVDVAANLQTLSTNAKTVKQTLLQEVQNKIHKLPEIKTNVINTKKDLLKNAKDNIATLTENALDLKRTLIHNAEENIVEFVHDLKSAAKNLIPRDKIVHVRIHKFVEPSHVIVDDHHHHHDAHYHRKPAPIIVDTHHDGHHYHHKPEPLIIDDHQVDRLKHYFDKSHYHIVAKPWPIVRSF